MVCDTAVEKLLESFDRLSETEKQEVLIGLLRRHRHADVVFRAGEAQATVSIRSRRADPEQSEIVLRLNEELAWEVVEREELVFGIEDFSLEASHSEPEAPEFDPQRLTRVIRPGRKNRP